MALFLLLICAPILLVLVILIRLTSKGPAIHWSSRVGKDNNLFLMPKFRSMYLYTPDVATHLLRESSTCITPVGKIMRKTSLDELPQLWSILKGDMNFVGPRPALHNQDDLVTMRDKYGVSKLKPGVTGWAQINGRDEISIPEKVKLDTFYLENESLSFDLKIIFLTFFKIFGDKKVSH